MNSGELKVDVPLAAEEDVEDEEEDEEGDSKRVPRPNSAATNNKLRVNSKSRSSSANRRSALIRLFHFERCE